MFINSLLSDKKKLAIIALILANLIWGAALPIYKWTLEIVPPFTFAFLRFFIASIIIFPFVYKKFKFSSREIPLLVFSSIISITFQIPLLFFGLTLSPSINAPIIISSGPIILIASSFIFFREKISKKLLLGTLISLSGVLVIILNPALKEGFGTDVLGNFFVFLATICGVIQALVFKKLLKNNSPLLLVFLIFVIGSITLIPETFIEFKNLGLFAINFQSLTGIAYAAILSSVSGYFLYMYGLKHINVSEIGIFSYVDPIATILIAVPLLNEVITQSYAIAAILVFLGIYVAENRVHYHPIHLLTKRYRL